MDAFTTSNPFAALTLIAAPAVLTNASSVLALGTSNRFARAVDRQRQLSALLEAGPEAGSGDGPGGGETGALRLRQLRRAERRAELLLRGLTSFYVSLASFAAAALVSVVGAAAGAGYAVLSGAVRAAALGIGLVGVGGLVFGCSLLVRETRLTLHGLREEADFSRRRFEARHPGATAAADAEGADTAGAGGKGGT